MNNPGRSLQFNLCPAIRLHLKTGWNGNELCWGATRQE